MVTNHQDNNPSNEHRLEMAKQVTKMSTRDDSPTPTNGAPITEKQQKVSGCVVSDGNAEKSSSPSLSLTLPRLLSAIFFLGLGLIIPPLSQSIRIDDPCSAEQLENFLHDQFVPGFHIVCLKSIPVDDSDVVPNTKTMLTLRLFQGGTVTTEQEIQLGTGPIPWTQFSSTLTRLLDMEATHELKQPWAAFSSIGQRLATETDVDDGEKVQRLARDFGMLLIYEGGQFLWPGVRIGFKREVELDSFMPKLSGSTSSSAFSATSEALTTAVKNMVYYQEARIVTIETLSLEPLVLSVEGFLSNEECEHIQNIASPHMKHSTMTLNDQKKGKPVTDIRTSQSVFLRAKDPILKDIDDRTASLTRIPRNHQEKVQVLRYGYGERYTIHTDYFDAAKYTQNKRIMNLVKNGRRNRFATVFWYLSDVTSGGETIFPRFNGGKERSSQDCETGLKVQPEMGKVIIFYSLTHRGDLDRNSHHGSCPVHEGIKWASNKWIWNEPMHYVS